MAEGILALVEYREIPGFEGYYAGSDGSIWSSWKSGKGSRWRRLAGKAHVRSGHLYVKVKFRKQLTGIHHLVLFAFSGPMAEGFECRHLNGNPADNRPSNLKWGTRKENVADAIRHGTHAKMKAYRAKLQGRDTAA